MLESLPPSLCVCVCEAGRLMGTAVEGEREQREDPSFFSLTLDLTWEETNEKAMISSDLD